MSWCYVVYIYTFLRDDDHHGNVEVPPWKGKNIMCLAQKECYKSVFVVEIKCVIIGDSHWERERDKDRDRDKDYLNRKRKAKLPTILLLGLSCNTWYKCKENQLPWAII